MPSYQENQQPRKDPRANLQKSILITGCSSGIGLHCAQQLTNAGYRVFAGARRRKDVDSLKKRGLEGILLDLDDSTSLRNAVSHVMTATNERLYALFNNGAYGQPGAVEDLSRDVLRRQFETNFFGTVELTNLILPYMRSNGEGRVIQNSSILGFVAMPMRGAYNASKFALEGITDTLRLEFADTNIQFSLIEPGPITSQFRHNALQALKANINIENSHFNVQYQQAISRLEKKVSTTPFTLGPDAVYQKLLHALEAPNAKPRYYVTKPTHVAGVLKRLLPTVWLDKILKRG